MRALRLVNRTLRPFGVALVPRTSAKMLVECANVVEVRHPSRGGRTVRWLRETAGLLGVDEYRRS